MYLAVNIIISLSLATLFVMGLRYFRFRIEKKYKDLYEKRIGDIKKDVPTGRLGLYQNSHGSCEVVELCKTEDGISKVHCYNFIRKYTTYNVLETTTEGEYTVAWLNKSQIHWLDNWKAVNRDRKIEKVINEKGK